LLDSRRLYLLYKDIYMMLRKKISNDKAAIKGAEYWALATAACDELEKKIADEKIETTPEDRAAYTVAMTLIRKQLTIGLNSDTADTCQNGVSDKKKYKADSDTLTKEAYPETGMPVIKGVLTLLFVEQIQSPFLQLSARYVPNTDTLYTMTKPLFNTFAQSARDEKTKKAEALEELAKEFRSKNQAAAMLTDNFLAPKKQALTLCHG
jgi:hypothetical protein